MPATLLSCQYFESEEVGAGDNFIWKVELLECILQTVRKFLNFKGGVNAVVALGSGDPREAVP